MSQTKLKYQVKAKLTLTDGVFYLKEQLERRIFIQQLFSNCFLINELILR